MINLTQNSRYRRHFLSESSASDFQFTYSDFLSSTNNLTYSAQIWNPITQTLTSINNINGISVNNTGFTYSLAPTKASLYKIVLTATDSANNITSTTTIDLNATGRPRSFYGTLGNDIISLMGADQITADGGRGDDAYYITKNLHNNAVITDNWGNNDIYFENGVQIADAVLTRGVLNITLTNSVTVAINGANNFDYFYSNTSTDLTTFLTNINAVNVFTAAAVASIPSAVAVTTAIDSIKLPEGGTAYLGSNRRTIVTGSSGADTYIIDRYQTGSLTINDASGADIVSLTDAVGVDFNFSANEYSVVLNGSSTIKFRRDTTFYSLSNSFTYDEFYNRFDTTNDRPNFTAPADGFYSGASITRITRSHLGITDSDSFDKFVFISVANVANGQFTDASGNMLTSFTLEYLQNSVVNFSHSALNDYNPSFTISYTDQNTAASAVNPASYTNPNYFNLLADPDIKLNENASGAFKTLRFIQNQGDNFTFTIAGADAGRFAVDNSGGLSATNPLDYEAGRSEFSITISATKTGTNLVKAQDFVIYLQNKIDTLADGGLDFNKLGVASTTDGVAVTDANQLNKFVKLGDINGDGIGDYGFGDTNFDEGRGAVNIILGTKQNFNEQITANSTPNMHILGNIPGLRFGETMAGVGDVNGDGIDDFVITAPLAENGRGDALLVYGRNIFKPGYKIDELANDTGLSFKVNLGSSGKQLGEVITAVGDVNGDGFADFVVAGEGDTTASNDIARAILYFGHSNTANISSITINRINESGLTGINATRAGDINGDGFDDILITQPNIDQNKGRGFVIFGQSGLASGGNIDLNAVVGTANQTTGIDLRGGIIGDNIGSMVVGGFDINGDGYDDLAIAGNSNSYIFYGNNSISGAFTLDTSITSQTGAIITNTSNILKIDSADINNDGYDDVIFYNTNGFKVVFGSTTLNDFSQTTAMQAFQGGAGADSISLTDITLPKTIDGGNGLDSVIVNTAAVDFSKLRNGGIKSIERLDLNLGAAVNISLTAQDVWDMSDHILANNHKLLTIDGQQSDSVKLLGAWTKISTSISGYDFYGLGNAEVKISTTITPTFSNTAPDIATPAGSGFAFSVNENMADPFYVPTLNYPERGERYSFTISGGDSASFVVDNLTGAVKFLSVPDFEHLELLGNKSSYTFTLTATDGLASTTKDISVTLQNLIDDYPASLAASGSMATPGNTDRFVNAGDINGDGFADIIYRSGSTYNFVYGNGLGSFTINSDTANGPITITDLNGDGLSDVVLGNPTAATSNGRMVTIYGQTDLLTTNTANESSNSGGGSINLKAIRSYGFVGTGGANALTALFEQNNIGFLSTTTTFGAQFASSLSHLGDINGDGYGDIMVGTRYGNQETYAVVLGDSSVSETFDFQMKKYTFFLISTTTGDTLEPLDAGGNFNNDNFGEFTAISGTNAYIILGSQTFTNNVYGDIYNMPGALVMSAPDVVNYARTIGDMNFDGYDEIAIGYGTSSTAILYGSDNPISLNLASLSEYRGFTIHAAPSERIISTQMLNDFNGDGFSDILVAGNDRISVIYGGNEHYKKFIELGQLDGTNGINIALPDGYLDGANDSVTSGDVNGDGLTDLTITDLTNNSYTTIFGFSTANDINNIYGSSNAESLTLFNHTGGGAVILGAGDDTLIISDTSYQNMALFGGAGVDTISFADSLNGASYSDTSINFEKIIGTSHDDKFTIFGNITSLTGGAGNDTFVLTQPATNNLHKTTLLDFDKANDFLVFDNGPTANNNSNLATHFGVFSATFSLANGNLTIDFVDASNNILNEIVINGFSGASDSGIITYSDFSTAMGSHLVFG